MATVEWLRPNPEVQEAAQESPELSYIKAQIADFMRRHEGVESSLLRAPLAIELVERLRLEVRAEPGEPTLEHDTLLDAIDWQAWNELWFYSGKTEAAIAGHASLLEIKNEEYAAKDRLYDDIASYDQSTGGTEAAHRQLLADYHLARLVIKNPTDPVMAASESLDHIALAQMLSVHKLVKGLRSAGFSRARRSTLPERDKTVQAIVPIGKSGTRTIPIVVQPGFKNNPALTSAIYGGRLLVDMPYYPAPENYFTMPESDKAALRESIKAYRGRLLGQVPALATVNKGTPGQEAIN